MSFVKLHIVTGAKIANECDKSRLTSHFTLWACRQLKNDALTYRMQCYEISFDR